MQVRIACAWQHQRRDCTGYRRILQDIESLGEAEQQIQVAHGFARNYLYPRKKAEPVPTKPGDRHSKLSPALVCLLATFHTPVQALRCVHVLQGEAKVAVDDLHQVLRILTKQTLVCGTAEVHSTLKLFIG